MDLLSLMKNRYSLRRYSSTPVEQEKLDAILEAGRFAPTAENIQPQRILVIDGVKNADKLAKCTLYHFHAPMVLLVCYDKEVSSKRNQFDGEDCGPFDATIVTTQMMLMAEELGLGTCWVQHYEPDVTRKEFDLKDNYVPVAMLTLGYPAENARPSRLHAQRKELSETVFYEIFEK